MEILTDLALYRPENEEEWDARCEATEEVAAFLNTLEGLGDIETRDFADWVAEWAQKYHKLGASDTTSREAVYLTAERYLSLLELVREAGYMVARDTEFGATDLRQAVENVKGYFGMAD